MIRDFHFVGFTPEDEIRRKAYVTAGKILDSAPYGSALVAMLEKDESSYRCAIEIYSKNGPFTAQASDSRPSVALERVERKLLRKLNRWKKFRRFSSSEKALRHLETAA